MLLFVLQLGVNRTSSNLALVDAELDLQPTGGQQGSGDGKEEEASKVGDSPKFSTCT